MRYKNPSIEAEVNLPPELYQLLPEYHRAIDTGNAEKLHDLFNNKGFPVNYKDPLSGLTALHLLAGTCARHGLAVLLQHPEVDFLIRDHRGCLASEYAMVYSDDPEMAVMIIEKEMEQGERMGIKVTRRPSI